MKAPLYNDILSICQEISGASSEENDELRLANVKKLQILCATNQNSPKDHPLQWEALADFTDDGEQAIDIYHVALTTAENLALPTFIASAYLAIAQRYEEFEEQDKAIEFAKNADIAAKNIESAELKDEIAELLIKLQQA